MTTYGRIVFSMICNFKNVPRLAILLLVMSVSSAYKNHDACQNPGHGSVYLALVSTSLSDIKSTDTTWELAAVVVMA